MTRKFDETCLLSNSILIKYLFLSKAVTWNLKKTYLSTQTDFVDMKLFVCMTNLIWAN
jgi:hypothetical protein